MDDLTFEALKMRVETLTKANRKLTDENKELKEQIKPQENFDEFLRCTKDYKTHITPDKMKTAIAFALNNGDVELIMDKYLLTNGEEKILKELTDRQYGTE